MSRRLDQVEMDRLYGFCHYVVTVLYDIAFRGEVAGLEHVPRRGPFLIACNHASHLDPPIVGGMISRQVCFFARKTLWHPGFATWWLNNVGTIPVDRDGGSDVQAFKRVLQALKEEKALILFPEGTRSPDGQLQKAKPGVGLIVCKSQVPVVPVRIFDSHRAFGRGGGLRLGTPIDVVYGPPLAPSEYDPGKSSDRYQIASERIMAAIGRLERPRVAVN
jgi:1-acyl-sn-glycerol-3-phosphate acyltransferase